MKTPLNLRIYLFSLFCLSVSGCGNNNDIDTSNIELELTIQRFDRELANLNPENLQVEAQQLRQKHGVFYQDYVEKMLEVGNPAQPDFIENLSKVLSSDDYVALQREIDKKFQTMDTQEKELTEAFKRIKFYYPQLRTPQLYTFLSGFAIQTPIGGNYIGIGLDMFLGQDSKFYPALRNSIPAYISRRFSPENITPRVMETFIREELFPEPEETVSLMQKMIYNGKILFFMDIVMPSIADSLKIGYSAEQQKWADDFEAGIWGYFLENDLLYQTDYQQIQKYLTDAPFTPGIGNLNESAPKLAVFSGWKIVKNYMKKNESVTIQELMADNDFQKILEKAKYRPE